MILLLEQEGEHLHQIMNALERRKKMIIDRAERFWSLLEDWENKIYSDSSMFETRKSVK